MNSYPHKRRSLGALLAAALAVACGLLQISARSFAQQTQPASAPGNAAASAPTPPAGYTISPGDMIQVKFTYNPELNSTIPVRPDGAISLAMVGDVAAQGLSPTELSKDITARYGKFLEHPQAVVIVTEFAGQRVYVGGEVNTPCVLLLRGSLTGLQAVMNAGGAKLSGRMDNVILIRYRGPNRAEVRKLNLKAVTKGGSPDIALEPYDVIYVPKKRIAKVGSFVEEYINDLVPRNLLFPYNVNNTISVAAGR